MTSSPRGVRTGGYAVGTSESLAQTTLQWLPSLPLILLPQTMSLACVDAVVGKLLSRSWSTGRHEMRDQRLEHQVPQLRDETQDSEVVVIVDHANWNAVCAAVVVELLLKEHFPMLAFARPQDDLLDITKTVLVLCSNGCFSRPLFVKQLFQARALAVGVIPIVAETNFQFPTTAWYLS